MKYCFFSIFEDKLVDIQLDFYDTLFKQQKIFEMKVKTRYQTFDFLLSKKLYINY